MASVSLLERVCRKAHVLLHGSGASHGGPVDKVCDGALTRKWALARILAIAPRWGVILFPI